MIYVTQYDCWWSFTDRQWRQWLPTAIASINSGEGYLLPHANRLNRRPRCVGLITTNHLNYRPQCVDRLPDSRWWYPTKTDVRVIQPLDWTLEQWEEEAKEVATSC